MAKIDRYDGNLAAFASQADTNRRTTFGTETTGDNTLDGNLNADFFTGWQIVGPNEFPTLEDFNAAFFTIGQLMAYMHQVGVPEWNGDQEFHSGSMTNRNGVMYICNTDNHVSATPPEDDDANWRLPRAEDVSYDSTDSGLTAETAQAAIDELFFLSGYDREWQSLLASRSQGVLYTNSTGRTIAVSISSAALDGARLVMEVDGQAITRNGNLDAGGTTEYAGVYTEVPDGSTYELIQVDGTLQNWSELR